MQDDATLKFIACASGVFFISTKPFVYEKCLQVNLNMMGFFFLFRIKWNNQNLHRLVFVFRTLLDLLYSASYAWRSCHIITHTVLEFHHSFITIVDHNHLSASDVHLVFSLSLTYISSDKEKY